MNEELNITNTNEDVFDNLITYEETANTTYEVATNIHTILCVLTFTVIIIFLYKYLKNTFFIRK